MLQPTEVLYHDISKRRVQFEDLRDLPSDEVEDELQKEESLALERGEKRKENEDRRKQMMKERKERKAARKREKELKK